MPHTEGERRHGYPEIAGELRSQRETLVRLALLLEGTNNDGFVSNTRHDIRDMMQWQEIHDALCKARDKEIEAKNKGTDRKMAILALVLTGLTILSHILWK